MKFKIDTQSIKFRLWLYFVLFAAGIMALLWFLQIFFLNNYYASMKEDTTDRVAMTIISDYSSSKRTDKFIDSVNKASSSQDIYTYFETLDGYDAFPTLNWSTKAPIHSYSEEKAAARQCLTSAESTKNTYSFRTKKSDSNNETLVYASRLSAPGKDTIYMYLFSPLYPVTSTVNILTSQLLYVTIIAIVIAFLLSFYLSSVIANPLKHITKKAERLAKGKYGVTFQGGKYSEISELADTLTHTSLELDKTDAMQKDLIANVSHDLKTPLTMIKSYAEMIQDISGNNPEKRNQHLQVIIEETDRLNVLVSDMLAISRLQSGSTTLNRSIFNLKETVNTLIQSYEVLKEQEGIHVFFVCHEKHIFVNADEEKIKQVFSNLINNAVKFCGADKSVVVNLKKRGNRVICKVTDHGIGIPENELQHIWERYYKASSNMVREVKGSGLGLSIVKEILSLHQSNFGVESKIGMGTTFWFELNTRR